MFKNNKHLKQSVIATTIAVMLSGCGNQSSQTEIEETHFINSVAPGAPGDKPYWAYSGKTGIGTSYEA